MMKKSGRIIGLMIAVMLSLSLVLTGCGTSKDAGSSTPTASASAAPASSAATETPKQLEPYEVVWYQVGNGMTPDVPLVQDEIAKLAKDINTTLKLTFIPWGEYTDKLNLLIQSGEVFDLCFASWNYSQNATKGAFVDLTDKFETSFPNYSAVLDPGLVESAKINGKLYALPTNKEAFSAWGFNVDREFAEQAGIDLDSIKTFEDMGNALRTIKQKMPDITPLFMRYQSSLQSGAWDQIGDNGTPGVVMVNDQSVTVVDQYQSEEMMNRWKLVNSWYKEGLINSNPATVKENTLWEQRKAFADSGPLGPVPEWVGPSNNVLRRVVIDARVKNTGTGQGAMVAISTTSKNPDRAMLFFDRFATNADMINLVTNGIEGKHYQIKDNTTTPPTIDYLPGQDGNNVTYKSGGAWNLGCDWFLSYLSTSDPKDRNDVVLAANKEAVASPALGFTFDSSPVANEIAACNNVMEEFYWGLSTGMLDPDKYAPQFIEKMKSAGSDKIVAEKQKQIDAWKAASGK